MTDTQRKRHEGALTWREAQEDAGLLYIEWEFDDEGLRDWYCVCGCQPEEVLACVVYIRAHEDDPWRVAASLSSIGDPDAAYRRIVETELCLEAMAAV